jgi:hypothetical protein
VIFKENNHPIGKSSPNLVTLSVTVVRNAVFVVLLFLQVSFVEENLIRRAALTATSGLDVRTVLT